MPKRSAGLLMYRWREKQLEVLLIHPGGPFWVNKDDGAWSISKGEYTDAEEPLHAAQREFQEETGFTAEGPFQELGEVRQASGKLVRAWAFAGDCDPAEIASNLCEIEWPPRSGRRMMIPEVDRGAWFTMAAAHQKLMPAQRPFLDRLAELTELQG